MIVDGGTRLACFEKVNRAIAQTNSHEVILFSVRINFEKTRARSI